MSGLSVGTPGTIFTDPPPVLSIPDLYKEPGEPAPKPGDTASMTEEQLRQCEGAVKRALQKGRVGFPQARRELDQLANARRIAGHRGRVGVVIATQPFQLRPARAKSVAAAEKKRQKAARRANRRKKSPGR